MKLIKLRIIYRPQKVTWDEVQNQFYAQVENRILNYLEGKVHIQVGNQVLGLLCGETMIRSI